MGTILVLNRLRQLAFRASEEVQADAAVRAVIFRSLSAPCYLVITPTRCALSSSAASAHRVT